MNEKDLLDLKKRIDTAKVKVSELRGKQKFLMEQLKSDFDCTDLDEAKDKLDELQKEADTMQTKIDRGIKSIYTKLPKDDDD